MVGPHEHRCARCGFTWACLLPPKPRQKVCPVDMAVRINKTGPDCLLCHHLVMAARVATLRGLRAREFAEAISQCWAEAVA